MTVDPKAQALADTGVEAIKGLLAMVPQVTEPPPPPPHIVVEGGVVAESAGKFVGKVRAVDRPFRAGDFVRLQTAFIAGEASEADMVPQDVILHAEAGATEIIYEVPILQDTLDEHDEKFLVNLVEAKNDQQGIAWPVIDVAQATVTIVDDDEAPPPPPSNVIPKTFALTAPVQPRLVEGRFITPVALEKNGEYTLYVTVKDRYNANQVPPNMQIRYLLNRQRIPTAIIDPNTFIWDKSGQDKLYAALPVGKLPDGVNELGCRILGAPQANHRVRTSDVVVGVAPSVLPEYDIPVHGHSIGSSIYGRNVADRIKWPGGNKRPRRPGRSKGITLVPGITESGGDPNSLLNLSNIYIETFNHMSSGLYYGESDYRMTKNGWVIARPFTWQSGTHSAPAATINERRKPEYYGEWLRSMLDGYSTYRFGDYVCWAISLRGTLARIDLRTRMKEAVAGRVYKLDTVALDHSDDSITQAQIDAANYEFKGGAVTESDLDWDGPHDFYPAPWDPDNQGLLLDSFHHRGYWVDANVSPARVTKLFGNGPGRSYGDISTAQFNRPYAALVYADRRIVICNTPKAGEEKYSSIVEISSDWKSVREVVGPDVCSRPFWLCEHEDGKIVWWEIDRGGFHRVKVATGELELFWGKQWTDTAVQNPDGTMGVGKKLQAFLSPRPDGWATVCCDVGGTMGPQWDVFFSPSSSTGNTTIRRFDRNGVLRDAEFLKTPLGRASQGPADRVFDLPCHYPWSLDIHKKFSLAIMQGFGNTAPIIARRRLPTDPTSANYDHYAYGMGEGMFQEGSLPNFPCSLRPSGRSLYSGEGHTFLDLPSLTEIVEDGDDASVMQYMRAGYGGSVPRPEWDGEWAKPLLYWLRYRMGQLPVTNKPPVTPKKPAPVITSFAWARDDDGMTVWLTTDKPTFCCIEDGNASSPSGGYAMTHILRLLDCGPAFRVLLADLDRNELLTENVIG